MGVSYLGHLHKHVETGFLRQRGADGSAEVVNPRTPPGPVSATFARGLTAAAAAELTKPYCCQTRMEISPVDGAGRRMARKRFKSRPDLDLIKQVKQVVLLAGANRPCGNPGRARE
jgi:hypothetical protein